MFCINEKGVHLYVHLYKVVLKITHCTTSVCELVKLQIAYMNLLNIHIFRFQKDVTHSQLKISELDSYNCFFAEYQNGANAKRRAASVPYAELFQQNAQSTRSVIPFQKIAFPEMQNPDVDIPRQPLCDNRTSMRILDFYHFQYLSMHLDSFTELNVIAGRVVSLHLIFHSIVRFLNLDCTGNNSICSCVCYRDVVVHEIARARASTEFRHRVVYDLDSFACEDKTSRTPPTALSNNDRARVGHVDTKVGHLLFESRFECGNLRRATQSSSSFGAACIIGITQGKHVYTSEFTLR
ncbi:hypothetical protein Y032_0476g2154 [Ancylostoma ceylanicum]|uniref:Uncharacterized protein n=1 Tax=Ancylostoma ceylanicum TaxID=53326 RepID=A0A016WWC5_9BILA|nr:hypothetical protein Y032_0476g2154 [Ancylostoma ceylanicum]